MDEAPIFCHPDVKSWLTGKDPDTGKDWRQKDKEEAEDEMVTMVSTGDRSAKIRTYNYPQGRVTDHRVEGLTVYNLAAVMDGDLDEIINRLQMAENAERLKENIES